MWRCSLHADAASRCDRRRLAHHVRIPADSLPPEVSAPQSSPSPSCVCQLLCIRAVLHARITNALHPALRAAAHTGNTALPNVYVHHILVRGVSSSKLGMLCLGLRVDNSFLARSNVQTRFLPLPAPTTMPPQSLIVAAAQARRQEGAAATAAAPVRRASPPATTKSAVRTDANVTPPHTSRLAFLGRSTRSATSAPPGCL